MNLTPLTWRETRARMRADHQRLLLALARSAPTPPTSARLHPSFLCVALYRLSNHLFRAGHGWLARLVWHLKVLITGADISYLADLGPGLVVLHPAGVSIMGAAGRNLTVMAGCGLGGEVNRHDDIAGWPGVPRLGDDVLLEPHSGVLGPVHIGHRVRIGAGVVVTCDVGDDRVVARPEPKFLRRRDGAPTAATDPK
jgi:serine O-acetyltransferase